MFSSMSQALAAQNFRTNENLKKELDELFSFKRKDFLCRGVHEFPKTWKNVYLVTVSTLNEFCLRFLWNEKECFHGWKTADLMLYTW